MRTAFWESRKIGAEIFLGDRPVEVTLKRAWHALGILEKARLLWHVMASFKEDFKITEEEIDQLKDADVLEKMLLEMAETFPGLSEVIIHERDLFLASSIQYCASQAPVVVAVVGMGHVAGILSNLPKQVDRASLLTVPQRPWWRKWILAGTIGGVVLGTIYWIRK